MNHRQWGGKYLITSGPCSVRSAVTALASRIRGSGHTPPAQKTKRLHLHGNRKPMASRVSQLAREASPLSLDLKMLTLPASVSLSTSGSSMPCAIPKAAGPGPRPGSLRHRRPRLTHLRRCGRRHDMPAGCKRAPSPARCNRTGVSGKCRAARSVGSGPASGTDSDRPFEHCLESPMRSVAFPVISPGPREPAETGTPDLFLTTRSGFQRLLRRLSQR